jgi:pyridoxamine 5'-phosphate oxidase
LSEHVDPAGLRRQYDGPPFDVGDLAPTWLEQLQRWLDDAVAATLPEPNAMVVATADASGAPSARTVLLRGVDERGLTFYTNLESRKGREALANPRASAVFAWVGLQRQIVVTGDVQRVTDAEADSYWAARPIASRVSAAASPQSQVVGSREELERTWARVAEQGEDLPRPAHWSGLRIVPGAVEFWQGRRDRFHDRLRFRRDGETWVVERLAP